MVNQVGATESQERLGFSRKRKVSTELGAIEYLTKKTEDSSLSDLVRSIETLSSQITSKEEPQQRKMLRKIRKKILLFEEQILPLKNKRGKHAIQSGQNAVASLNKIEKELRTLLSPTMSKTLKEPLFHTLRLINRTIEKHEVKKPVTSTESRKRAAKSSSEEEKRDIYECLSAVEKMASTLKESGEQNEVLEKIQETFSTFEEAEPFITKTKIDVSQVKNLLLSLLHIKQKIREVPNHIEALASLERIEKRFVSDMESTTRILLADAEHSANPFEILKKDFSLIQSLYGADVRFQPFLHDAERLITFFQNRPITEVTSFLILLLQKTLLSDPQAVILTPLQGHEIAAQALFLLDQAPERFASTLSPDFSKSIQNLKEKATTVSLQTAKKKRKELFSLYGKLYPVDDLEHIFLPKEMARQLILSDGSLNLGFVSIAKDTLLSGRRDLLDKKDTSFTQHIVTVLHHLQSDTETVEKLESIQVPKDNTVGSRTVKAMLLKDSDEAITSKDTHSVVLSSLLTWQRQENLGLCFMYSFQHQLSDASLRWVVDDFDELLSQEGVLRRTINHRESDFLGLEVPEPVVVKKVVSKTLLEKSFAIPSIQHACKKVGCTSLTEFTEAIQSFGSSTTCTLEEVFEKLTRCANFRYPPVPAQHAGTGGYRRFAHACLLTYKQIKLKRIIPFFNIDFDTYGVS